jgi:hypothetical protein
MYISAREFGSQYEIGPPSEELKPIFWGTEAKHWLELKFLEGLGFTIKQVKRNRGARSRQSVHL